MPTLTTPIIVDGYAPAHQRAADDSNVRDDPWRFALDQRAFGPRKLWVAFAESDGRFTGLAYTKRTNPIDPAFDACIRYLGQGAVAAVAYLDERVAWGPPPAEFDARFTRLRAMAASYGITLVEWISCDDDAFRAARMGTLQDDEPWWNLDVGGGVG